MNGKNGLADLICLPRRLLLSIDWNSWSWGKQRNWIVKIPMSSNIRKIFKYHWLPKPLLCSTLETICVIFMIIPNIFTWYIEVYFKRFILCHVLFLLRVILANTQIINPGIYTLKIFIHLYYLKKKAIKISKQS